MPELQLDTQVLTCPVLSDFPLREPFIMVSTAPNQRRGTESRLESYVYAEFLVYKASFHFHLSPTVRKGVKCHQHRQET